MMKSGMPNSCMLQYYYSRHLYGRKVLEVVFFRVCILTVHLRNEYQDAEIVDSERTIATVASLVCSCLRLLIPPLYLIPNPMSALHHCFIPPIFQCPGDQSSLHAFVPTVSFHSSSKLMFSASKSSRICLAAASCFSGPNPPG